MLEQDGDTVHVYRCEKCCPDPAEGEGK
jgi:hypothetical protein